MDKRGAIFYIIDAFVASAIIAITITVIFSTRVNVPESEQVENAFNHYIDYIERTSLREAPGKVAKDLIKTKNLDGRQSILEVAVQLVNEDDQGNASELMRSITTIVLESQYGINITVHNTSTSTEVLVRNEKRAKNSDTLLKVNKVMTFHQDGSYEVFTRTVPSGSSGDFRCAFDDATCIYINSTGTLDENNCHLEYSGASYPARCLRQTEAKTQLNRVEVSLWP